ncbi:hypothetical protein [Sorangium sp. So ce542]|uniref:hypothetical protein n=1 Tax=Sorangium sp. So ce542 TaxID=3133316 RepID=UPI003F624313
MTQEKQRTFTEAFPLALARAWNDKNFMAELIANPAKALEKLGCKLPPGLVLKMNLDEQSTDILMTITVPPAPPDARYLDPEIHPRIGAC